MVEPQVEELPDGRLVVEGSGLTAEQARLALEFFRSEWGELVGHTSQEMRRHLMSRLLQSSSDIVEPASLAQARRQAALKASLLESPVYTYETLSEVRDDPSVNATRTAVSRARQEGRVFTVTHEGRTLLPAFQFEPDGSPRADLAPLLGPLLAAQLGSWQMWTWLTRPAALLSGLVPEKAAADPATAERAARAAQRLAARVPSAGAVEAATRQAVADFVADAGDQVTTEGSMIGSISVVTSTVGPPATPPPFGKLPKKSDDPRQTKDQILEAQRNEQRAGEDAIGPIPDVDVGYRIERGGERGRD